MRMIINWIERLFGIDELKKNLLKKEKELEDKLEQVDRLDRLARVFENASIGIDVNVYNRSWAVICLGDPSQKRDNVYFFQFEEHNIREIADFLKMFDRKAQRNAIVDCPWGVNVKEIW